MPIKKKKQSRMSLIGRIIKTPKGRLLATILIFAVIGGGILVYKSFAATPSRTWSYSLASGNLYGNGMAGCTNKKITDAQFKVDVLMLVCPTNYYSTSAYTDGAWLPASYGGKKFRFCAYVKGKAPELNIWTTLKPNYQKSNDIIRSISNFSSNGYGYFCTSTLTMPKVYTNFEGRVEARSNSSTAAWVNVGGIVLEML